MGQSCRLKSPGWPKFYWPAAGEAEILPAFRVIKIKYSHDFICVFVSLYFSISVIFISLFLCIKVLLASAGEAKNSASFSGHQDKVFT